MEPWFFWDEDPQETKPARFGRFSRAAKSSQDGKPAKAVKERKPAKAVKERKPAKAVKEGKAAKAHEPVQACQPVQAYQPVAAHEPVQADAPTLAIEPVLAGEPTLAIEPVLAGEPVPAIEPVLAGEPVPAGEPAQAVPEAGPDGGHRGSRARLVRRPIATTAVLAGLLAVVGGAIGLTRLTGRPADVPRPVAKSAPAPHGLFAAPPQPHSGKQVARPVDLIIPVIHVRTALETLGRTPQGTLQVPDSTTIAGWYSGSPRPGEIGSSIIAGHIDSATGPGVFFRLRLLRPGNLVYVQRKGGALVVFRVTAERMYSKPDFPTKQVYGPVPDAELRLITCGGVFDPATGSYLSNVVVYATQISVGQPSRHHHGRRHHHHPLARHS